MQVRGNNYLIPLDADIRSEDEVAFDSIDAQSVLEKMECACNRVNQVISVCMPRQPFFVKNSRSAAVGLATMNAPSGSLVAYSTAPGSIASDGTGRNGLYTEQLARMMLEPGLPVEDVFKRVRVAVRRASNSQQTPWENTALEGRFYFSPVQQKQAAPQPVAQPASRPDSQAVELAFILGQYQGTNRPAELQAYLDQFQTDFLLDWWRACRKPGVCRKSTLSRSHNGTNPCTDNCCTTDTHRACHTKTDFDPGSISAVVACGTNTSHRWSISAGGHLDSA